MNEAIRTRNPWQTAAVMLLAVLVLLVIALMSMLQPAATTGTGGRAMPPEAHATSKAGPVSAEAPYVDRHAEVVAAYQSNPR
jgi:hypothetical protein